VSAEGHKDENKEKLLDIQLSRLRMLLDGVVPREAFANLSGKDFWTFMTVRDLEEWPEKMNFLKDYVEFYEEPREDL
jgi:hypothetical protein